MNIDKMRGEFEAWARSGDWTIDLLWDHGYAAWETQCAFDAWQQSRSSLVIELPQRLSFEMQGITVDPKGDLIEYCDTVAAIQSTGVKVK